MFAHGVKGNVLRRLGGAENLAGVFVRKKPCGNHDEQPDRRQRHGKRTPSSGKTMAHDRFATCARKAGAFPVKKLSMAL